MSDRPPIDPARIRRRMRDLEQDVDPRPGAEGPSILEAASRILGLSEPGEPLDAGFVASMQKECQRAIDLVETHYSEWVERTARTYVAIGFLQGLKFTAAIRDIIDAAREAHETAQEAGERP